MSRLGDALLAIEFAGMFLSGGWMLLAGIPKAREGVFAPLDRMWRPYIIAMVFCLLAVATIAGDAMWYDWSHP